MPDSTSTPTKIIPNVETFDENKNAIYIGNKDKLKIWINDKKSQLQDSQVIHTFPDVVDKVRNIIKSYLELDNVNFLFGTGSSLHLGAASIRNFPKEIEDYIKSLEESLQNELFKYIKFIQSDLLSEGRRTISGDGDFSIGSWKYKITNDIVRDGESGEIACEFERILNYLIAKDYTLTEESKDAREDQIDDLIKELKQGLFDICNVDKRNTDAVIRDRIDQMNYLEVFDSNKYFFHERFLRSLLLRPLNLKRANIFTSNYDLAFEYAFDKLGIYYINGFSGFHKRFFKPETFDYDIFYPGSTTSGKVQRIEKVVKYYKLHGSISWVRSSVLGVNNMYGIEEKPIDLIEEIEDSVGDLIIYPSAVKKTYTLDMPYSELFRQFATAISVPQSVLFTIGYSFGDEHFNDIINQALTNPTFTLIVVDYKGTSSPYIEKLKDLDDPRIIILEGNYFGDFLTFATKLMPSFSETDTNERVLATINNLMSEK